MFIKYYVRIVNTENFYFGSDPEPVFGTIEDIGREPKSFISNEDAALQMGSIIKSFPHIDIPGLQIVKGSCPDGINLVIYK